MVSRLNAALVLAACCLSLTPPATHANAVYWGLTAAPDPNLIQCSDRDGGNVTTLFALNVPEPRDMFLDPGAGKLYFSSANTPGTDNRIRRMNLDGTNDEDLVLLGAGIPSRFTGSPTGGKMYWYQITDVFRANLDGSSVELINTVPGIKGLAISPSGNDLYWIRPDAGNTIISRADPDGTNVSNLLVVPGESPFIGGLSIGAGRLYWTNFSNEIRHATVSGTDLGVVLTADTVLSIFVDGSREELYWITLSTPPTIWRSDLTGASPQAIAVAATGTAFNDVAVLENVGIPTVSTWGLAVMALMCLTAGAIIFRRRFARRLSV